MAGCNPRKCSIDFGLIETQVVFSLPIPIADGWCLGTCSVIDADRAEGLDI